MIEMIAGLVLLVAYALFFYKYHFTNRRSLVYYSLALFGLAVPFFTHDLGVYLSSLAFSGVFLWLGNLNAMEESFASLPHSRELRYFSFIPPAALIFFFPRDFLLSLSVIVVSILLAGVLLLLSHNEDLRGVGYSEIILALAAFLCGWFFESPYSWLLMAAADSILLCTFFRAFLGTPFLEEISVPEVELPLKDGIVMMNSVPDELLRSALVFSRSRLDFPNSFWITKVSGERSISPTNLAKMLDMAVHFMATAQNSGSRGVVVIDGLEYLVLENGFEAVLKFLTTLRDYAVLYGGTVILLGSDSFLGERERTLLRRLLS